MHCAQCSTEAALHTELAVELVECISWEGQQEGYEGQFGGQHLHRIAARSGASSSSGNVGEGAVLQGPDLTARMNASLSALEEHLRRQEMQPGGRATGQGPGPSGRHVARPSSAAAASSTLARRASGATPPLALPVPAPDVIPVPLLLAAELRPVAQVPRLLRLRAALLMHLHRSQLYDAATVLAAMRPLVPSELAAAAAAAAVTPEASADTTTAAFPSGGHPATPLLLHERVLLLSRLGQHAEALRLLALQMDDVDGCIEYCRRQRWRQQQEQLQRQAGGGQVVSYGQDCWLSLLRLLLRCERGAFVWMLQGSIWLPAAPSLFGTQLRCTSSFHPAACDGRPLMYFAAKRIPCSDPLYCLSCCT